MHMHTGHACLDRVLETRESFEITTAVPTALAALLPGTLLGCIWSSSGPVGRLDVHQSQAPPEPLITWQCLKLTAAVSE